MTRLFAVFALFLILVSCAATQQRKTAQKFVTASAVGVAEIDLASARRYTEAADRALEETETRAEYEQSMRPWNQLEVTLRGAHSALLATQEALRLWELTGDSASFLSVAPCLLETLQTAKEIVDNHEREFGFSVPSFLSKAIDVGVMLFGGREECRS